MFLFIIDYRRSGPVWEEITSVFRKELSVALISEIKRLILTEDTSSSGRRRRLATPTFLVDLMRTQREAELDGPSGPEMSGADVLQPLLGDGGGGV